MACIKTTPLRDPDSQLLMETLGFVNRIGLSTQSVWADPSDGKSQFFLDPNTIIRSARQVVRLSYELGLKQGEKNARFELNKRLKTLSSELIDSVLF